jgi:hypothetical protein
MNPDNVVTLSIVLLTVAIGLVHHHRHVLRHRSVQRRSDEHAVGGPRYPFSARF